MSENRSRRQDDSSRNESSESRRPVEVAVVGGGCAALATAFELTRPELRGKFHVTVYQVGSRLGGKAASGRGVGDRIEEHGIHVWYGCYENAFRLLRECYAELRRDPAVHRFADWRDAFTPCREIGVADRLPEGGWAPWMADLRPAPGLPGDPLEARELFSLRHYLVQATELLRTLLSSGRSHERGGEEPLSGASSWQRRTVASSRTAAADLLALVRYTRLATVDALIRATELLARLFAAQPWVSEGVLVRVLETIRRRLASQLDAWIDGDSGLRRTWEVADLVLAAICGAVRFRLASDPRGFDAIDEHDFRAWLRLNGAAERSLESAYLRGLYDICFAYEDGDPRRPRLSAGQALRTVCRMFFTYRGPFYWRMNAGMGDVVIAPFYEVLRRRGVSFRFFHRLENVRLAEPSRPGERPYVEALEFDVQAEVAGGGEYQPLVDVRGLPCWPSRVDHAQLVDGERLRREGRDFESYWDRRRVGAKTLRVVEDFDFVVLALSVGAIPRVASEILERDVRWRAMVTHVGTVATQAFQLWLTTDMAELGWERAPGNVASFVEPFNTWTDMGHLRGEESWPVPPRAIAYFCSPLPTSAAPPDSLEAGYPERQAELVRGNAVRFLNRDLVALWPRCQRQGTFRWDLVADPAKGAGEDRFDSQYWTANVNPSDRYVLSLPGSSKHRISPLDNTYDNLTVAGDWTGCGFNAGSVETAVISGRLAAHALSGYPPLEDIVGFDHP